MDRRFGLRDAVRALSESDARGWPAGVIHHGARVLLLMGLALAVSILFPVSPVQDFPVLEKGMVAEEDIIAQVGFPIFKSELELERERAEAAAGVPPILDYVPSAVDTVRERVETFLASLEAAVDSAAAGDADALAEFLNAHGFPVTEAYLDVLADPRQRGRLATAVRRAIEEDLPVGVIRGADLEGSSAEQLRLRRDGVERTVLRDSLHTASWFYDRAARHLRGASAPLVELQRLVLVRFFEPTIRLNEQATEAARERMRQAVPTIKGEVVKGEKIVGAHELVRDAELEKLRAYQEHLARIGQMDPGARSGIRAFGAYLFNLLILSVFGLLLYFFRPTVYHAWREVLLVAGLILAVVAASALIGRFGWPPELIPIAFPALAVAALWDGRMALNLSLVVAILLSGQTPFLGTTALFTTVLGGAAAGLSVRVVRRRAQTWIFISAIAGAYVAVAITLGMLRSRTIEEILLSAALGIGNAMVSGIMAMGLLPLFETFTRITTDMTLLELTDLNRPLLKRLALEAPGTYAHSINVANLAEAAARAIGANALLARVGVYYHDVGKLVKPQYFIENQPPGRNPHDKLKPAMSAAIVRNHVVEGLKLAAEAKLPRCVRAFIAEHHGTQPISFFYDRARELDPDAELDPVAFSYPGPKPQSRETAIAMLADSVESAARALQDPTPQRIRALVDRLVGAKVAQGQLDESPLTLRELTLIKDQLAAVLTGMYHHRIDYPSTREATAPQPEPEAEAVPVPPGPARQHG
ncbi:MAG TPA: HDIG domain-containing metalloprotein [Longimicrobiales bacterium]